MFYQPQYLFEEPKNVRGGMDEKVENAKAKFFYGH